MTSPIRPPPKPGQVKVFRALYDYKAQNHDELSFQEGDILYIIDMITNKNWWKANCNDKTGFVPCNYSKRSFVFCFNEQSCIQKKTYFNLILKVEESTENVVNPLHEASKRGNIDFMKECLANKVGIFSFGHCSVYRIFISSLQLTIGMPQPGFNHSGFSFRFLMKHE
jgi:hypothetical protein